MAAHWPNPPYRPGETEMNIVVGCSSMKKTGTVFLFFLYSSLIMSSGTGHAANERWKAIAGKSGAGRILYDPDSIVPSGPRTFRVWIMGFDANGFPRKSREEFDCTNRIVRDVEVISERPRTNRSPTHSPLRSGTASSAKRPGGSSPRTSAGKKRSPPAFNRRRSSM